MTTESLPLAHARTGHRLLVQHLVSCPGCGKPAAAHVDPRLDERAGLVRFVCPEACAVSDDAVLARLPDHDVELTA